MELVKVWKSTCEPAVRSGRATDRCRAAGSAAMLRAGRTRGERDVTARASTNGGTPGSRRVRPQARNLGGANGPRRRTRGTCGAKSLEFQLHGWRDRSCRPHVGVPLPAHDPSPASPEVPLSKMIFSHQFSSASVSTSAASA